MWPKRVFIWPEGSTLTLAPITQVFTLERHKAGRGPELTGLELYGEPEPLKHAQNQRRKTPRLQASATGLSPAAVTALPDGRWQGVHITSAVSVPKTHKPRPIMWKSVRQTQIKDHATNYPTKHPSKLSRSWKVRKDGNCHGLRRCDNWTRCDVLEGILD